MKYGFNVLNLHKLYLIVDRDNARAIHIYQELGFEPEGSSKRSSSSMANTAPPFACACSKETSWPRMVEVAEPRMDVKGCWRACSPCQQGGPGPMKRGAYLRQNLRHLSVTLAPAIFRPLSDLMSGTAVGGLHRLFAHAELTKPATVQLEHRNPL